MSKVFYSQPALNLKMTTLLNNLTKNNDIDTYVSKEFYEKNRKIKEKYMRKVLNPYHVFTKKQALSDQRKDNKYRQINNNQYHNRTSKIKEKLFCLQDEIDLEQDLENEHKISQEIVKSIAQEALAKIWFHRLIEKTKEDERFESMSEQDIMYFMEHHDVDPAQLAIAEEGFQRLQAQCKRYAWFDDDNCSYNDDDDAWYTGCWH
jgi:hypothetical protein